MYFFLRRAGLTGEPAEQPAHGLADGNGGGRETSLAFDNGPDNASTFLDAMPITQALWVDIATVNPVDLPVARLVESCFDRRN